MSSRLRAACLFALIAVAAVSILPKNDLPETTFDETDAPTIQTILTNKAASLQQGIPPRETLAQVPFARMAKARMRGISPVYKTQSSESRQFQAICILRC
jgi:hypothetical protein